MLHKSRPAFCCCSFLLLPVILTVDTCPCCCAFLSLSFNENELCFCLLDQISMALDGVGKNTPGPSLCKHFAVTGWLLLLHFMCCPWKNQISTCSSCCAETCPLCLGYFSYQPQCLTSTGVVQRSGIIFCHCSFIFVVSHMCFLYWRTGIDTK